MRPCLWLLSICLALIAFPALAATPAPLTCAQVKHDLADAQTAEVQQHIPYPHEMVFTNALCELADRQSDLGAKIKLGMTVPMDALIKGGPATASHVSKSMPATTNTTVTLIAATSVVLKCDDVDIDLMSAQIQQQNNGTPIPEQITAMAFACEAQRLNAAQANAQAIPVVVQREQSRVMFGLVSRADVQKAGPMCQGLVAIAPAILSATAPGAGEAVGQIIAAQGDVACDQTQKAMLNSNPLVLVATSNVVAVGIVNKNITTIGQMLGLKDQAAALVKINNNFNDSVGEQARKSTQWVIDHPQIAYAVLGQMLHQSQIKFTQDQIKQMAKGVTELLHGHLSAQTILEAANPVGGVVAQVANDVIKSFGSGHGGPIPVPPVSICAISPYLPQCVKELGHLLHLHLP